MKAWLHRLGPFAKGLVGAMVGTVIVLLIIHLVTLYIALLRIITFINAYADKIKALP